VIAQALKTNRTLQQLFLTDDGIGREVLAVIGKALGRNRRRSLHKREP